MRVSIKTMAKKGTPLHSTIISIVSGLILFTGLLLIFSLIIMKSSIELENIKLFLYLSIPLTAALSGFMNAYMNKVTKGMLSGVIAAAVLTIIISSVLLIINSGGVEGNFFGILILAALAGIPAGILGANIR